MQNYNDSLNNGAPNGQGAPQPHHHYQNRDNGMHGGGPTGYDQRGGGNPMRHQMGQMQDAGHHGSRGMGGNQMNASYGGQMGGGMQGHSQGQHSRAIDVNQPSSINEMTAMADSLNYTVDEDKRKQKVCVHWLKKSCKKGDDCEYLHVLIQDKVPICKFFQKNGHCHKEDTCVYRHPKPEECGATKKQEPCPFYERGFCKLGLVECMFWHGDYEASICQNYMLGFCPDGPNCTFVHVKSLVEPQDLSLTVLANFPQEENWVDNKFHMQNQMGNVGGGYNSRQQEVVCHRCGRDGHKSTYCQEDKIPEQDLQMILAKNPAAQFQNQHVTCFHCHGKGHYSPSCPFKAITKAQQNASIASKPQLTREEMLKGQIESIQNNEEMMSMNQSTYASSHGTTPMKGDIGGPPPSQVPPMGSMLVPAPAMTTPLASTQGSSQASVNANVVGAALPGVQKISLQDNETQGWHENAALMDDQRQRFQEASVGAMAAESVHVVAPGNNQANLNNYLIASDKELNANQANASSNLPSSSDQISTHHMSQSQQQQRSNGKLPEAAPLDSTENPASEQPLEDLQAAADLAEAQEMEELPEPITVTNVQLDDLPLTYEEIKKAVFDMAQQIQLEAQTAAASLILSEGGGMDGMSATGASIDPLVMGGAQGLNPQLSTQVAALQGLQGGVPVALFGGEQLPAQQKQ